MRRFRTKPANKYRARRTRGYASKREAAYAEKLATEKAAGIVLEWLEQVPIKLPGCKYVVDFVVFGADGTFRLVEVTAADEYMRRRGLTWLEVGL